MILGLEAKIRYVFLNSTREMDLPKHLLEIRSEDKSDRSEVMTERMPLKEVSLETISNSAKFHINIIKKYKTIGKTHQYMMSIP